MKKLSAIFIAALILFVGCKDSENPASSNNSTNTLTGIWGMNYLGNSNDTLSVTLNINGTNNSIGGNGSVIYTQVIGGTYRRLEGSGTLLGTYSDSNINVTISDFNFNGNKSGTNYIGTATYIRAFLSGTDTLIIDNATLIKQ
jgi:hypothetical protein